VNECKPLPAGPAGPAPPTTPTTGADILNKLNITPQNGFNTPKKGGNTPKNRVKTPKTGGDTPKTGGNTAKTGGNTPKTGHKTAEKPTMNTLNMMHNTVGPGSYPSPRHRFAFGSSNQGSNRVSMTQRAMSTRPGTLARHSGSADIDRRVIKRVLNFIFLQ
jgi:hypothetical protein